MKSNIFEQRKSGGVFSFQLRRNGEIIDAWEEHNLMPTLGINHCNDVVLSDATRVTAWYIGLYSNTYTPQADDAYTHIGSRFTELNAQYDEAARPTWTPDAEDSVAGLIDNTDSRATFTFNQSATIAGAFFVSSSIKGDNAAANAVMLAASAQSPSRSVLANDELLVKYSFQGTSS